MRAAVETGDSVVVVDLEEDELVGVEHGASLGRVEIELDLPLVIAADQSGPTIVALVERRPPLVVSRDAGTTWNEIGAGLPPGRAIAISPDHPDLMLFASESRLHVSRDGGRFWHALTVELEDIRAVAWLTGVEDDL
jgi:hypothetical protein